MKIKRCFYVTLLLVFTSFLQSCDVERIQLTDLNEIKDTSVQGTVYGADDRADVEDSKVKHASYLSDQVAAIISNKYLTQLSNGDFEVKQNIYDKIHINGKWHPLCPEEPFIGQTDTAKCTATLLSEDRVLTAGHCVASEDNCKKVSFVFNYKTKKGVSPLLLPKDDVYTCKRLLRGSCSVKGEDWALIELDRKVVGVKPAKVGSTANLKVGDGLFAMGFTWGMPMKVTSGYVHDIGSDRFYTNTDTSTGNSGSPIFEEKNGDLIGMLFRGNHRDYRFDSIRKCAYSYNCPMSNIGLPQFKKCYETIMKIEVMKKYINAPAGKMKVTDPGPCGVPKAVEVTKPSNAPDRG